MRFSWFTIVYILVLYCIIILAAFIPDIHLGIHFGCSALQFLSLLAYGYHGYPDRTSQVFRYRLSINQDLYISFSFVSADQYLLFPLDHSYFLVYSYVSYNLNKIASYLHKYKHCRSFKCLQEVMDGMIAISCQYDSIQLSE